MRRVQADEPHLFAVVVRRHQAALLRVARSRLGRTDAAEEVVQETLLAAYKSRATFNPEYTFRTWLWTILINQCHGDQRRSARRRCFAGTDNRWASAEPLSELVSAEPAPLTTLLAKERGEMVEQLLAELSDVQADALRLRFYAGMKYQEIADTMQCSLSTAKNRVRWGLLRISEILQSQRMSHTDGKPYDEL